MTANPPAANVPYYTPAQTPPAGTFLPTPSHPTPPTLFSPLTIRSVTLVNRLAVAPMCMYSSPWTGHLTDFHLVHLGQFALHGSGLVMVEATAVQPRGRITPEDSGIWDDSHVAPLRRIADYIRSQGHVSAIQLAHAGRKASELAPWVQNERLHAAAVRAKDNGGVPEKVSMLASAEEGGWVDDVVGPSAIPLDDEHASPRELTLAEIDAILEDYKSAARRAVEAGFDVIEIHGAHGFLISSFLSPLSNKRIDKYGGSFKNRARLLFDVITAIRSVIPATMPLFLRLSATEWMEHTSSEDYATLDLATTIRIAKLLPAVGVDLLDVSSGGNSAAQKIPRVERYQIDLAKQIRAAVRDHARETGGERLLVAAVGRIASAALARDIVQQNEDGEADADLVFAAKQHLRDPAWVLNVARELGVAVKWPHQYHRAEPRSTEL